MLYPPVRMNHVSMALSSWMSPLIHLHRIDRLLIRKQTNGQRGTRDVTYPENVNKYAITAKFSIKSFWHCKEDLIDHFYQNIFKMMALILTQLDGAFSLHSSLTFVSGLMICWGFCNFVMLQFTTAPYGRYSRSGWGTMVPAKLAWFLQELPSFIVPLLIVLGRYEDFHRTDIHDKALIGCFLAHYFHR